MNKSHKHAEVIKAWADGAQVEYQNNDNVWCDCPEPLFSESSVYRVKPPAPEKVYVTTQMSGDDMYTIYMDTSGGPDGQQDFIAVANAALRHAVDNGYLFTKVSLDAAFEAGENLGRVKAIPE